MIPLSAQGRLRAALLPGLLLALAAPLAAEEAPLRTRPVADGLHVIRGPGGNVLVSTGEDGPLVVDDQVAPRAPELREAVRALQEGPVRFVVNTHWHADHTGGNELLAEEGGAVLVAHRAVRARLREGLTGTLLEREIPPAPAAALPDITFGEGLTFHWNGQTVEVVSVAPAHTDGDALVWFREADVLHAGDVYFNGLYPFIDVESGGTVDGVLAAVDAILERAGSGTRIVPGHGPVSNRAELRVYRRMLKAVRDRVAEAVAEGKDAEAVVEARPSARFDAKWGGGFLSPEQFVRILHADLSRAR